MNYRHRFHAGNVGDVVKHVILVLLLEHLRIKPASFAVLDSHAGIGLYDLTGDSARRTLEYQSGIARLLGAPDPPPPVRHYLDLVAAANPGGAGSLTRYPGSPWLARALLRPGDRLTLTELHPEDAVTLKQTFHGDRQVAVHEMDGYQALKAHLPPKERRGLVLIDPPYEAPDEYGRVVAGLKTAHRRWPTGLFAVWYPIKERAAIWRFHEAVAALAIGRILTAELTVHTEERWDRLNGCGMLLINPPWRLDATLAALLPWLHHALGATGGSARTDWLVPEAATTASAPDRDWDPLA